MSTINAGTRTAFAVATGLVLALGGSSFAHADEDTVTIEKRTVTPQPPSTTVQVQAAPAPAPVPAPVQAVPVQAPVSKSKSVVIEDHQENFMVTIAKSTFFGALTGAMIGGAIYLINRPSTNGVNVAYWTGGGALVGAGVGLVQIAVNENRTERATAFLDRMEGAPQHTVIAKITGFRF